MKVKTTKHEQVFEGIRSRIIDNQYKPGMMLVERQICNEFDTSRTPIREAFRTLANAGLVQIIPQKGVFVVDISIETMIEIFEMREALETMAIKLFVLKADQNAFDSVIKCAEEHRRAFEDGDADIYIKKDMEFHNLVARGSKNVRLANAIRDIYDQVSMLATSEEKNAERRAVTMKYHEKITNEIKNKDAAEAAEAMRKHVLEIKEHFVLERTNIRLS